jgi:hypothetical protein
VRDVLGLAEVADFYKDRGWVGVMISIRLFLSLRSEAECVLCWTMSYRLVKFALLE